MTSSCFDYGSVVHDPPTKLQRNISPIFSINHGAKTSSDKRILASSKDAYQV